MTKKELFLANADGYLTDKTPVWIMRQAGRYLPEYRKIRKDKSFEDICKTPRLAAEVTIQPVRRFGLDAAIIFSDILFVLEPLGFDLKYNPGPVITPHLKDPSQIDQLKIYDPADRLGFVGEAIIETRKQLGNDMPILGFCGAPFTVFSFMCGYAEHRDIEQVEIRLNEHPDKYRDFLNILTDISIGYLKHQIDSGADAVQIFDTLAGQLTVDEFEKWSLPYLIRIVKELNDYGTRTIVFTRGVGHILNVIKTVKPSVFSIDWKTSLADAAEILKPKALQGNFDPSVLAGSSDSITRQVRAILDSMKDYPGFIFNLGHGILPNTPVENVQLLVDTVHAYRR